MVNAVVPHFPLITYDDNISSGHLEYYIQWEKYNFSGAITARWYQLRQIQIVNNSQQKNLVYALWQEVPKLVYAFWTCKPVH